MIDDNKIVNGLWIGTELTCVEILTIASFINHGHEFHLWTYDEISTKLPSGVIIESAGEIIPKEKIFSYKNRNQFGHGKGSFAGFSDIFRYKLLFEKGGWWVDMDVTCLKPFDFTGEYVFRQHHSLPLVGNIMKCPKGSLLMKECFEKAVAEVDENNTDWHKPIEILADAVRKMGLLENVLSISNQDSWQLVRKLLTGSYSIPPEWYAIHWVNEEFRRNKISKKFFKQKSVFNKLMLQHSLLSYTLNPEFFERCINDFRLSFFVAATRQIPSYLRGLKESLLFHLKKV